MKIEISKKDILAFSVISLMYLCIDTLMIFKVNSKMYMEQFERINKGKIKKGIHTYFYGILTYTFLIFGLYWFCIKSQLNTNDSNLLTTLLNGLIYGLVVYSTYNGTNIVTINEWGANESIIDSLWGSTICGFVAVSSVFISNKFIYKSII
jgi:uncharacterized membrane protein